MRWTLLISALTLFLWSGASAQVARVVSPEGSGAYATIADALSASSAGDVILLEEGVFTGPGNRGVDVWVDVTIQAFTTAVIDCEGADRAFFLEGAQVTLRDLTITGGQADDGGAILMTDEAKLWATDCRFVGNAASDDGGAVHCAGYGELWFTDTIFAGNAADGDGGALYLDEESSANLWKVTAVLNSAGSGSVTFLDQLSEVDIDQCIFAFNPSGEPCSDYYSPGYTVTCTDVYGNHDGDWVHSIQGMNGTNGNLSVDPLFCDPMGDPANYALCASSPVADGACNRMGALDADPGWTTPVYGVAADGSGMFATIQEAIDGVPTGAHVLLEDGVYTGDGNHALDSAGKDMTLASRGGDAVSCILDCEGSPAQQRTAFRITGYHSDGLNVRHLTVRNGYSDTEGGGVSVVGGSIIRFVGCAFEFNTGNAGGGAVRIVGPSPSRSRVDFQYCSFVGNSGGPMGGAIYGLDWNGWLHENDFLTNVAVDGGAIAGSNAHLTFQGGDFDWNAAISEGGAVRVDGGGLDFQHSRFRNNEAAEGGAVTALGTPVELTGCTFESNSASLAGGALDVRPEGSTVSIEATDCTFLGNSSDGAGAVIRSGLGTTLRLTTCTLQANVNRGDVPSSAAQISVQSLSNVVLVGVNITGGVGGVPLNVGATVTVISESCNVWDNSGGDYVAALAGHQNGHCNISLNPLYCDPAAGDLTVHADSPCLAVNNGCGQDIGAHGEGCSGTVDVAPTVPAVLGLTNSPNPFNPVTRLSYELGRTSTVDLTVYDLGGRLIRTLRAGAVEGPGPRSVDWDGRDGFGRAVPAGVYLVRLRADGAEVSRRVALAK